MFLIKDCLEWSVTFTFFSMIQILLAGRKAIKFIKKKNRLYFKIQGALAKALFYFI